MPKKSESTNQPQEAPAEDMTPAPQPTPATPGGAGAGARVPSGYENAGTRFPQGLPRESGPQAPAPEGAENGKAAPPSFSGLRGADYVRAITNQQLVTIEIPLLPTERRGDWERAKGVKIRVTTRQLAGQEGTGSPWLERAHALAALVIELQRPGATRFDQIDLPGSQTREAIERLSDYVNQARLRAQAQTGKKWTASQVYLIPLEDA